MTQTKHSPERQFADLGQRKTNATRRLPPVDGHAWTGMDWLIVCAILACAVLLAKVVGV